MRPFPNAHHRKEKGIEGKHFQAPSMELRKQAPTSTCQEKPHRIEGGVRNGLLLPQLELHSPEDGEPELIALTSHVSGGHFSVELILVERTTHRFS